MRVRTLVLVAAILGLIPVAGCVPFAQPARPEQMTAYQHDVAATIPDALRNQVALGNVTGGEPTNPLWTSEIDNPEFRAALEGSLRSYGFLATGEASAFKLDADLVGVDQPVMGFDVTVTSTVSYRMSERASGNPAFVTTIVAPFTATMSDAFSGVDRLRLANEGSIKENIRRFLDELRSRYLTAGAV